MDESMHTIEVETYSYKDYKEGAVVLNDPYGIGAYAVSPERRKAIVENPFVKDENCVILTLVRVDGIVGGRAMLFPTKFKAGEEFLQGNGGSTLFVHDDYRQNDIAVEIVTYPIQKKISDALIYADFTPDGINTYQALRFCVFSLKKMIFVLNSRIIFKKLGKEGFLSRFIASIANVPLKVMSSIWHKKLPKRLRKYKINEVDTVPEWVDDFVLDDGHKFMEVHNHQWLQWCLDNKFHNLEENVNRFFIIERDGVPFGFFMTKERLEEISSNNNSMMSVGSLVEWGSKDEKELSEYDIIRMSLPTFSKKTDMFQIFSDNECTIQSVKRIGFLHHGQHYIVFRDMTKRFKDAKDQKLWRLRFGYSDSIMN